MYRRGAEVADLAALEKAINDGRWLYWCNRVKHPQVIANMSLNTVRAALRYGRIFYAERNASP